MKVTFNTESLSAAKYETLLKKKARLKEQLDDINMQIESHRANKKAEKANKRVASIPDGKINNAKDAYEVAQSIGISVTSKRVGVVRPGSKGRKVMSIKNKDYIFVYVNGKLGIHTTIGEFSKPIKGLTNITPTVQGVVEAITVLQSK